MDPDYKDVGYLGLNFLFVCLFLSGLDRVTIQFMDSSIPGRNHDPQIIQFDKANSTLQKIVSQQP